MPSPWEDLLTETDREVIRQGGYGRKRGLGVRPALVVIDVQANYFGRDEPILDQIGACPSGVGRAAWQTLPRLKKFLEAARAKGLPVFFTRQVLLRATAVDAVSLGYHAAVANDCVFDRIELSHKAALLDLWMKYSDLMDSGELVEYIEGLN